MRMRCNLAGIAVALGLALGWASPILAQQSVSPCTRNAQGGCTPVTSSTPLATGAALRASPTWTVQTSAYSSGNSLGGLLTISAANLNGGSGFVTNLRITDKHADTTPTLTVFLYDHDPTGVGSFVCTDKSAFVNDPGVVHYQVMTPQNVTLAVPTGATYSYASIDFVPPRPFALPSTSHNLFACVVVQGSLTPNSASDFFFDLGDALN